MKYTSFKAINDDKGVLNGNSLSRKHESKPTQRTHHDLGDHISNFENQFNSLAPGRCDWNDKLVSFKRMIRVDILSISYETALRKTPQYFVADKSILIQVMVGAVRLFPPPPPPPPTPTSPPPTTHPTTPHPTTTITNGHTWNNLRIIKYILWF